MREVQDTRKGDWYNLVFVLLFFVLFRAIHITMPPSKQDSQTLKHTHTGLTVVKMFNSLSSGCDRLNRVCTKKRIRE